MCDVGPSGTNSRHLLYMDSYILQFGQMHLTTLDKYNLQLGQIQ